MPVPIQSNQFSKISVSDPQALEQFLESEESEYESEYESEEEN